jgi:23S rRNA pseudouridine2605 synthase
MSKNTNNFSSKTTTKTKSYHTKTKVFVDKVLEPSEANSINGDRIAKKISHLGYCSRREAERLIDMGQVKVNGVVINTPAFFVKDGDIIEVEGTKLSSKPLPIKLYAYYKPKGLICSYSDEMGRETIFDNIPKELGRLMYVGRLDYNSEGLLLLTNNGPLAKQLTDPQNDVKRVYKVRVFNSVPGSLKQTDLDRLAMGVTIEGIRYKPIIANIIDGKDVQSVKNMWLEFTITEGKNREVRKICDYLGLQVNRLIRTQFSVYKLGAMNEGEVKEVKIPQ